MAKLMLMLDVPVAVPLAGLHGPHITALQAGVPVAVTDAVGLDSRFWTDVIAKTTTTVESPSEA